MEKLQKEQMNTNVGRRMTTKELKNVLGGRDIKPTYEDNCTQPNGQCFIDMCLALEHTPNGIGWYYTAGRCVSIPGGCHCEPYPS